MTALEFAALGGRIDRRIAGPVPMAPRGRLDIQIALREEIARRTPMVRELPAIGASGLALYGRCEICGDEIAKYTAGMCEFCGLARFRHLVAIGSIRIHG